MFVIEVIPLSRNAPAGTLSYRVSAKLAPGSLVEVPLRKQRIPGIVVGIESVRDARTTLRKASYTLRAGNPKLVGTIPSAYIDAAKETAALHATTLGAVLAALVPEIIPPGGFETLKRGEGFKESVIELPETERAAAYVKRASLAAADNLATLVLAPTVVEAERLADYCKSEGLATTLLTGALSGKRRALALAEAANAKGVVVATPSFCFVPIRNLGGAVLERESAGSYVGQKRPYLDTRVAARALARARGLTLTLGDYPLRMESRPKTASPLAATALGSISILDVRKKPEEQKTEFKAVPDAIREELKKVVRAGGRAAVLTVRKGYAPAVVCKDCGTLVKDERGRPLALVGTASGKPVLRSADGETRRDAKALCDTCGSWNLLPLGIGVERVVEELRKALPEAEIIRFDAESVKTPKQAKIAVTAASAAGTILVGTEAMLPWLDPSIPLDYAAVASADSLLALPFWRARERLVHLVLTLHSKAKRVAVATRKPEDAAFTTIKNPADTAYFEDESMLRKALKYPPYATLISLTYEGSKERVEATAAQIAERSKEFAPLQPAPRPATKGRYRGTTVLRIAASKWPDEKLGAILATMPPGVRVLIDPESFW
jgi:primosomal protein N' (replication factor Y)